MSHLMSFTWIAGSIAIVVAFLTFGWSAWTAAEAWVALTVATMVVSSWSMIRESRRIDESIDRAGSSKRPPGV